MARQEHLLELKTRADALMAVEETDYERWHEIHGTDPEPD